MSLSGAALASLVGDLDRSVIRRAFETIFGAAAREDQPGLDWGADLGSELHGHETSQAQSGLLVRPTELSSEPHATAISSPKQQPLQQAATHRSSFTFFGRRRSSAEMGSLLNGSSNGLSGSDHDGDRSTYKSSSSRGSSNSGEGLSNGAGIEPKEKFREWSRRRVAARGFVDCR